MFKVELSREAQRFYQRCDKSISKKLALTKKTYHQSGGQYRFHQFTPFGGFDTLRRAA
jgi:hypothetical protein